ncbi:MAG: hypothetical protein CMJ81_19155 [Planctomycetaceae bacterium]|nr:hypothetical protein [Planctomycetaceae bacterium]MBP61639.1 hypothetical protein [Planctomycetaceae bacterium]
MRERNQSNQFPGKVMGRTEKMGDLGIRLLGNWLPGTEPGSRHTRQAPRRQSAQEKSLYIISGNEF